MFKTLFTKGKVEKNGGRIYVVMYREKSLKIFTKPDWGEKLDVRKHLQAGKSQVFSNHDTQWYGGSTIRWRGSYKGL